MFCSNCGSQNAESGVFCSSCGKAMGPAKSTVQEPYTGNEPTTQVGKKLILGMKPLIFGIVLGAAALLLAIVAIVATLLLNKPLPTAQTASEFMLTYKDVASSNLEVDTKPIDQLTKESSFIYGECSAKTNLQTATKVGINLGKNGFASAEDASAFWISSQLIRFPSEEDAKAVLAVLEDGAIDPECDTPNISDYYTGGEALSSTYGVNIQGVSLVDDWESTEYTKNILAVARRGNVLLYVQTHNIDSSGISASEVSTLITAALEKFNG